MRFKYLCFFVSFITLLFFSCSEDNDITVPRNLQEYLDTNPNRELENLNAFAASLNDSENATYIFYTPTESATEVRY